MLTADLLCGTQGRPSAPWHSVSDMITFAYLVRISKKYEVDTHRLLECIHYAWIKGESSFDDISIKRRQIIGDNGIFLVKQDNRILTQIRLTSKLLEYLGKTDFRKINFEGYSVSKARSEPQDLMIKDLNFGTKRFNLEAKVTEKSTPRIILSKWGRELLLSTATIMDRSGTIKLPLWNDQIGMVSVGDTLHIENAATKEVPRRNSSRS